MPSALPSKGMVELTLHRRRALPSTGRRETVSGSFHTECLVPLHIIAFLLLMASPLPHVVISRLFHITVRYSQVRSYTYTYRSMLVVTLDIIRALYIIILLRILSIIFIYFHRLLRRAHFSPYHTICLQRAHVNIMIIIHHHFHYYSTTPRIKWTIPIPFICNRCYIIIRRLPFPLPPFLPSENAHDMYFSYH